MGSLPDGARELIESGALAHLVTLNADGSPQVSCVWMGIERDELVAVHLRRQQKIRNIERDPRVVASFEGTRIHPPGLKEYLVVHGRARVTEGVRRSCFSGSRTSISVQTSTSRRCRTRRRVS